MSACELFFSETAQNGKLDERLSDFGTFGEKQRFLPFACIDFFRVLPKAARTAQFRPVD